MKKLPADIKDKRCRIKTLDDHILPKLEDWWGGDRSKFIQDLFQTNYCKESLQTYISQAEQKLKEVYLKEINDANQKAREKILVEINQHYEGIAAKLLKGLKISHSIYNRYRFLESFETQREANERKILHGIHRRTIPKYLENELVENMVNKIVLDHGGGDIVTKGKKWSYLASKLSNHFKQIDKRISNGFSFNYSNQYVREIYVKTSSIFAKSAQIHECIERFGGINAIEEENKWKEISNQLHLTEYDACWLLRETCKWTLQEWKGGPTNKAIRRRKKKLSTGEAIPSKVSTIQAKMMVNNQLFGQFKNTPNIIQYSDAQLTEFFNNNKIYIGYEKIMNAFDDKLKKQVELKIRVLNLRALLIQKTISLFKNGQFSENLPPKFQLYIADWIDGTSVLSSPFLACLVHILYDKVLFHRNSKISIIQKPLPLALTFNKETINNIQILRTLLGEMIKELGRPFIYMNHEITFCLKISKADNSGMEKAWGNSVGGHHKCVFCGLNFSSQNIISYVNCMKEADTTIKTLESIMEHHRNKTGTQIGISFLPAILLNDDTTPLIERGLDKYYKGHDRLHNTKGHMAKMFQLFQQEKGFNMTLALNNLKQYIQRTSFKENMKGADWRLFFLLYKQTLLPCIKENLQQAEIIIQTWLEIQYFCYQGILIT